MQTNILWTGRAYYSLENCLIDTTDTGTEVNSVVVGGYEGQIYRVEYQIRTNTHWETLWVDIKYHHSNRREHLVFECEGKGHWKMNGRQAEEFDQCVDIDISLTPFTNTLPVNRLVLRHGESRKIRVIYFDILQQKVLPVFQEYTRLSNTTYKYENVPNDFEAIITVDERGFVVDYPALFQRTTLLDTNYR